MLSRDNLTFTFLQKWTQGLEVCTKIDLEFCGLIAVFFIPANHELCVPDGRICLPDDSAILPVQVTSRERTAVVANYHSIGIQHWHQLEDELASQLLTAMEHDLENRLERSLIATGTQYCILEFQYYYISLWAQYPLQKSSSDWVEFRVLTAANKMAVCWVVAQSSLADA